MKGFLHFARPPNQVTFLMVCLEDWTILDVNNFLSKQNYYFVSLQVMQSPTIAIIVISIY